MHRALRLTSLLLIAAAQQTAIAQMGVATVRGSVVDGSGAGVPGAEMHLQAADGSLLRKLQTDAAGQFVAAAVPIGDYRLIIPAKSGFAAQDLPLHVSGGLPPVRVMLAPEAVHQDVIVANSAVSTDAAENRDAITTTADELRRLPVFDQDYVAALTPFLDPSAGPSGGVTLIVDGVEVKRVGVSASAIQEVRINNDPYAAEYNRPGHGRIEIMTKPGTPTFHGEVNFTTRDAAFNAKNYFSPVRPPESRRIFEGHLGGPIGRGGRSSFITSASYRQQNTAAVVNALGPDGAITANVLTPNRDSEYSMRWTHDFSPTHRVSLGYNFEGSKSTNAGVGGLTLPEAGYNLSSREDDLIFNDRLIISPRLINQLQVMIEKDEDVTKSVTNAQAVRVSGSFIGGGAQADEAKTENTIHVNEVLSWSHGKHYIRAGVQLPQFSRRAVDDHTNRLGTFKFASLADYGGNRPYVFTAQQGAGRALYWINEFGSFFQDQIKLNAKLQMSLGLRYDWQTFLHDDNNFAPRVSMAYAPGRGKTILRVGSGVFYERTGGDFPATTKLHDGVVLHTLQIQNPTYPLSLGTGVGGYPSNLVRFSNHVRSPYAVQYSVGVERQLQKSATVTIGYRGQIQVKSFWSRDANAPLLPSDPSLIADYLRPDPAFGEIQQIESGGRTLLNALDLGFRGQVGHVFSGKAQYVLSRYQGNTAGIGTFPQDQYHPNAEWGRADQDRLQRLNLMGTINPDHWLSLGVNATLYSGTPYTETTGNDDFHTGLGNARPAGVGRNTLQGGGVASLDLLYSHDFFLTKDKGDDARAVSASLSAFNVLNRTNYTGYIGDLTSSRFGRPTAALAARQIQFAVGYRF